MTERNPSSLTASMTEQQADELMELIEEMEKLPLMFGRCRTALTALCRHRDQNIECELLELLSYDWDALARFRQMQVRVSF